MQIEEFIIKYMLFFYCVVGSYFTARVSTMLDYAFTWGQLLDFVKLYFANKVNSKATHTFIEKSKNKPFSEAIGIFESDDETIGLYDYIEGESKAFRLLNCVYCINMWVSLIAAIIIAFYTGSWMPIFIVPILSNHMLDL